MKSGEVEGLSSLKRKSFPIAKGAIALLLLLLLFVGAVPSYLKGKWSWVKPPNIENLKEIKSITNNGIDLPGWKTLEQAKLRIGGHKWSAQTITQEDRKPIVLLLRPPNDHKGQPEVEWMDIAGVEKWKIDSLRKLAQTVETENASIPVTARFFKAWTDRDTFAVVQWYAWSTAGNPAPSQWFFADQRAQLNRERRPWVAVSFKIPIDPLKDRDIETIRPFAESLTQQIQKTLVKDFLSPNHA
ncbi:cyanoexosortase B system-associated protein [Lusitaniella coriacea LEGE 07157]|uniref:Cyanoexosortase B system-associated protein n=1 Tax=Lusitaniella coriacea LEGE 07157 TaxID=945747 RepID=A0A8J7E1P1_9CYAN|nr:cyanoexosortase B system-associated protein [Lusitaniella coriacea]MBE9118653.1 cyanoexosortase B system-associated protein [Lusitaniella coriacea LEGE 07157]